MCGALAVLACRGSLPVQLADAYPEARLFSLKGIPHELGPRTQTHQIEKLGGLFAAMKAEGCRRVVLAGGLARPALNPPDMDAETMRLAPRLMTALQGGDDRVLRLVIEIFEEQGFTVLGAHTLLPELTAEPGLCTGAEPEAADLSDAKRGFEILSLLSPLDLAQGCVVAGNQCLGIETLQGTDAMLSFVASSRPAHPERGVFVKAAKRGQDLRVDMPAIGPNTVAAVKAAGLAGIVIEANHVMMIEREATLKAVAQSGLFLTAQAL